MVKIVLKNETCKAVPVPALFQQKFLYWVFSV